MLSELGHDLKKTRFSTASRSLVLFSLLLIVSALALQLLNAEPASYAHAYTAGENTVKKIKSPLLAEKPQLFAENTKGNVRTGFAAVRVKKMDQKAIGNFAEKLYSIVGDAPIREMIPLIAKRDRKVAAFLVGIAKKESSFGSHSPWKDGKDCYNYWGYKGAAGRGQALGHACFASPEEAVEIVGNRIEVLVGKNRTTPAVMVHTWKCGTSCAGDPGAPSWVSTVTTIFEKILS